jgi:hypothetical protein
MDSLQPTRNAAPSTYIKRNRNTMSLRARYLHDVDVFDLSALNRPTHRVVTAATEILHPQPKHHTPSHRILNTSNTLPSLRAYDIEHSLTRPSNPIVRDKRFGLAFLPPRTPTWDLSSTLPAHVEPNVPALRLRPELHSRSSSWSSASLTQSSSSSSSLESVTPAPNGASLPILPAHRKPNVPARPEFRSRFSSWSSTSSTHSSPPPLESPTSSLLSTPSSPATTLSRPTHLARVIDHGGSVPISSLIKPVSRGSSVVASIVTKMRRMRSRVSLC